jgi:hypothetical protein
MGRGGYDYGGSGAGGVWRVTLCVSGGAGAGGSRWARLAVSGSVPHTTWAHRLRL